MEDKFVPEGGEDGVYVTDNSSPIEENTITFFMGDPVKAEMLKVAEDGFYVRGVKVEQDESEAKKVYDAFVEWLRAQGNYLNS
jgi:hypothetical protein